MEKLIIIGAGVAGLSCLNALLDAGESPLLIEGGGIGAPKICGEFLAPPAVPVLQHWGIAGMRQIHQVQFHQGLRPWRMQLSRPAVALPRHVAEQALAARARGLGARVREQTAIQQIIPATANTPFQLQCATGETLHAQQIMVATGKVIPSITPSTASNYVGFKTYIPRVFVADGLEMFTLKRGYLGIIPVSPTKSNLTCLIQQSELERMGGSHAFLRHFLCTFSSFKLSTKELHGLSANWLEGPAPSFGQHVVAPWPGAWWIGDALAAIHPSIGYGFAHSVLSALTASACYLHQDSQGYRQNMHHRLRTILRLSRGMHQLLQRPAWFRFLTPLLRSNAWLAKRVIHTLDY